MAYSQTLINLCKRHKLQIEDLVFCTLTTQGFNHRDAYIAAYRPNNNNPATISIAASKKLKEVAIQKYLFTLHEVVRREDSKEIAKEIQIREDIEQEIGARVATEQTADGQEQPETTRDKAAIIKELNEHLNKCTDPKQKQDWYKMLIDVQQMKKDTDETEEETIHYYFPVSCRDCQLYNDSCNKKAPN